MILGIETATGSTGVALVDGHVVVAAVRVKGDRRHAEVLAPAIETMLELAGAALGDVETIALDVGPGLFTGVRVGVATAQGLAEGLGIGVVEATSLSVLAREARGAGWQGPVAAVVDARRGEVFSALYDGSTHEAAPPERSSPEVLAERLAERLAGRGAAAGNGAAGNGAAGNGAASDAAGGACLVVGTGARRYAELLVGGGGHRGSLVLAGEICEPSASALTLLCAERLERARSGEGGAVVKAPREVSPVYLRDADARIGWSQR